MHRNFLPNAGLERTINATAAGVTTVNGAVVSHNGYRSITHMVLLGAVVDGTASSVKVQQGELADGSDMADVSGLSYTIADADDNKIVALELYKPIKAYSRVVVVRATQNVTIDGAIAVKNWDRVVPETQPSTVANATTVLPTS